jgi:hypothetical protein
MHMLLTRTCCAAAHLIASMPLNSTTSCAAQKTPKQASSGAEMPSQGMMGLAMAPLLMVKAIW